MIEENTTSRFYPDREVSDARQAMINMYRHVYAELAENISRDVNNFSYRDDCLKALEVSHMYLNKGLTH